MQIFNRKKINLNPGFEKFDKNKMVFGKKYLVKWQDGFEEVVTYAGKNIALLDDGKPKIFYKE